MAFVASKQTQIITVQVGKVIEVIKGYVRKL